MVGVCVFIGHQGGERDSTRNTQWQRRCVGDEWRSALQVCSVTARGVFMAYSRPWCRLNNVSFPFTTTSSKTRPEGGEDESTRPTQLRREVAASLWKLWCWPWPLIPRPPPETHLSWKVKSHWNFSAHAGERGVPEVGLKLSRKGQARIEQVTVVLGQCFPKPRQMRMHPKMLQGEDGLSHHSPICLEASSAAPKVRHHLPPGGDMTQRQKVTNLPLYPGRDLSASSEQETAAVGLSREQHFGLRNVLVEVLRFIYHTQSRHVFWRLSLAYPILPANGLRICCSYFMLTYLLISKGDWLGGNGALYISSFPPHGPIKQ